MLTDETHKRLATNFLVTTPQWAGFFVGRKMIKKGVLVVCKNELSAEPIRQVIEREECACYGAATGEEFIRSAVKHRDAVCAFVFDSLGDGDVLDLQRAMLKLDLTIPLVLVCDQPNLSLAITAIKFGASDVLTAPLNAISTSKALQNAIRSRGVISHRTEVREQSRRIELLSDRQRTILDLASQGYPNKRIASKLELSVKTVERDRKQAYERLGVRSTAEMTRTIVLGNLNPIVNHAIDEIDMLG